MKNVLRNAVFFKFGKLSTLFFAVVCILVMTVESVYALPVLTIFLFLLQQSLFSVEEQLSLSLVCGAVLSVLYGLPLVFGMLLLCLLASADHIEWLKTRTQVRDILLVLGSCLSIVLFKQEFPTLWEVGRFSFYCIVIISGLRLWARTRVRVLHK